MSRTLAHVLHYVSCCSTAAAPLRSRRRRLGVGGCAVESLADGGGVFYIYVAWFDDSDDGHHHHGGAPDCHLALLPSALSRLLLAMLRRAASAAAAAASSTIIIFLGPPGVGKGTYASRIAAAAGGVHIAAGDLVRAEIAQGSTLGAEMRKAAASGQLLGDEVIVDLVSARVAECAAESRRMAEAGGSNEAMQEKKGDGNAGSPLDAAAARGVTGAEQLQGWPVFVLDGVPRTVAQAEMLETRGIVPSGASISDVHKSVRVVNLRMREEALIDKLLARRSCGECGRGFNVADIDLPEDTSRGLPRVGRTNWWRCQNGRVYVLFHF